MHIWGIYAIYAYGLLQLFSSSFSAITGNWERKRPVWAMLMVNGLTKGDIASRGFPVLDLYLAQMAAKLKKKVFGFVCFRLTLKYSKRWAQLSVWRSSASPSMASPMARFTSHYIDAQDASFFPMFVHQLLSFLEPICVAGDFCPQPNTSAAERRAAGEDNSSVHN